MLKTIPEIWIMKTISKEKRQIMKKIEDNVNTDAIYQSKDITEKRRERKAQK